MGSPMFVQFIVGGACASSAPSKYAPPEKYALKYVVELLSHSAARATVKLKHKHLTDTQKAGADLPNSGQEAQLRLKLTLH